MAVEITSMHTDYLPELRLIGKRCVCHPREFVARWNDWFVNGWFEQLWKLGIAPEGKDAYIGATQYDDYWIGLLFPVGTPVPDGFEYADLPAAKYAIYGLTGKEDGELFSEDGAILCIGDILKRGLIPREGGWGLERYRKPATGNGNVLFEFLNSIE